MYILKNAWKNIIRNKGRNLLIAVIIIVVSGACAVTLSILNSANKIVKSYEESYEVEATIGINRNSLMNKLKDDNSSQEDMINKFNDIPQITIDEINKFGDSKYVKNYYYYYQTNMNAKDLKEATDQLTKETTTTKTETSTWSRPMSENPPDHVDQEGRTTTKSTTTKTEVIRNSRAANGAFTIKGYSSYESMTDFIKGAYTITSGEVNNDFTSNNCVISEELAELNSLNVGDKITLINPLNEKLTYELNITGIYKENSENANSMVNMFTSSANTIITNTNVVNKISEDYDDISLTITPTFILNGQDVIEAFTKEVEEKGLSEYYSISDNVETVKSATKSINNVKTFAKTFLIITLIIGGIVLFLINMINIRERKYEIGVLRTIGMKKSLVTLQFMMELLIVTLIGLILGAGIGATCSVPVANNLLSNEIENANEESNKISQNFGGNMKTQKDMEGFSDKTNNMPNKAMRINGTKNIQEIDSINAIVDYIVLLQLLGIGILLTVISSISACIAISRFQPLQILKERS